VNIPTAIFVTALFPIYLGISYYSSKRWGDLETEKNQIQDTSRGRIQEVISNIRVVKSFLQEKTEWKFIEDKQIQSNNIYADQSKVFHQLDFLRNLSLQIVLLIVNIIVFYNTFIGLLAIADMVFILQLLNQVRRPLFSMSFILTRLQNVESGSKEFIEILELESKEEFADPAEFKQGRAREIKGKLKEKEKIKEPVIEFNNVSFSYEDQKQTETVLEDISVKFKQNEVTALVGKSGAGKSTLINLILKFYEPDAGDILINGRKYSETSHEFIRNNVSLVFQDNELFSSTIRYNVAYGLYDASDEEIWEALEKANAKEFVQDFPDGLDTEIGERGLKLSGGQKQRLQLARALLADAPILILDEATSSLDTKSEREVQTALEALMKDKLVIMIAHRLSTIQDVDRILVIEDGKIADTGSPQELANKDGLYSQLLKYQLEGDKKLLESFEIY
jgi:ATP-binding cassette subfamily B protein